MGPCAIDKARAIAIADELDHESNRRYHWAVVSNAQLYEFLSRGDVEHFTFSDQYFPRETLELLDNEPAFRQFLSKPFAKQFNLVLTRAIDQQLLPVIETLFDGRRWVIPEDDDECLSGAFQRVRALADEAESRAEQAVCAKPDLASLRAWLDAHQVIEILNLLPTAFRGEQTRLVAALRSLAIETYNKHDDATLSSTILNLCKRFKFKSVLLNKRLEDDHQKIVEIISAETIARRTSRMPQSAHARPVDKIVGGVSSIVVYERGS